MKKLVLLMLLAVSTSSLAEVNIFTEHQLIYMTQHGVNKNYPNLPFPTGNVPYIGRVGIEYNFNKNISSQLSYIHRSNLDITHENEYNYNGISLGIKLQHCIFKCK